MKHVTIITLCLFCFCRHTLAQVPPEISFQAIARDDMGSLLTEIQLGFQVSILQGDELGPEVYVETHEPTTNENGLFTVNIGSGTVGFGVFQDIDWNAGPYFLRTELDPNGGTNYEVSGTSQILTIPFAFLADRALNVDLDGTEDVFDGWDTDANDDFSGDYNDLVNSPTLDGSETIIQAGDNIAVAGEGTLDDPYVVSGSVGTSLQVGDLHQGGIICYLEDGGQHGLVMSLSDLGDIGWTPADAGLPDETYASSWDGESNMEILEGGPVDLCADYSSEDFNDWFLPSALEWSTVFPNLFKVNSVLEGDGDPETDPIGTLDSGNPNLPIQQYWTSSAMKPGTFSAQVLFAQPAQNTCPKTILSQNPVMLVRAMRKF